MFDLIKWIMISEKKFIETNYKRFQEALVYIKKILIDNDAGMYLIVDYLIEISNMITGSNKITLRKVNVKPCGFNKMCMDKELIEDKFRQIIDLFNERKTTSTKFYSLLLEHTRYCLLMMM